ncbi:MAG TPA: fasciclin domain-containing protein [Chitinophagaceae bacterium]|nr:fasciclin domain-containing protein [Chitinophagaceae bacterium]
MRNKHIRRLLAGVSFLLLVYSSGCKKTELVSGTTDVKNIYSYLTSRAEFSEFVKVIDKAGLQSFLNVYGSNTFFAPVNAGVTAYMKEISKSIDQLNEKEAKELVTLHIIQDTLNTINFNNGKLATPTMFGQYLVAGVTFKDTSATYTINKQAVILEPNIKVGNGYIHTLNEVIKPARLTLAKMIEQDPALSIFSQALKETGWYDSLNVVNNPDTTRRYLTVLAETNTVLDAAGIKSFADLKNKYSKANANNGVPQDPKDSRDSLNIYVKYHVLLDAKYQTDLLSAASHPTVIPGEVILARADEQDVRLNYLELQSSVEQGFLLDRVKSDNSASNGALHYTRSHFTAQARSPYPIYWDVCETIPELRKMPTIFRKADFNFVPNSLSEYKWPSDRLSYNWNYIRGSSTYWGDYLRIPLGFNYDLRDSWGELKTPLILKGKYKVWVCYLRQKNSTNNPPFPTIFSFDGRKLERLFDFADQLPSGLNTGELEAIGYKRYMATNATTLSTSVDLVSKYLGTIEVGNTGRYTVRLDCSPGLQGQNQNNLDMIHFIPEGMNQVKRRFLSNGTQVDIQ